MTTLYLIRHAEAEGNAYRRIDGWYNSLITPNGLLQIEALRRRFEPIQIDACYASDLYRTCKTASAIYVPKALELHTDPRLREVGLGRWENHPFGELEQFEPELLRQFNHDTVHWHVEGSETWPEFTARFEAALRDIAAANAGKTVAVFAHGSVLRAFQQRLLGSENVAYCDNTSVSCLTVEDGTFRIDFLNDASHLTPDISTFERQKWWRKAGDRSDFKCGTARPHPAASTPSCTIRSSGMYPRSFPHRIPARSQRWRWSQLIGAAASASSSSAAPSVISAPRARSA